MLIYAKKTSEEAILKYKNIPLYKGLYTSFLCQQTSGLSIRIPSQIFELFKQFVANLVIFYSILDSKYFDLNFFGFILLEDVI